MMMIINRIFITVFLLSVAGTIVGSYFLGFQSLLYKHSSAAFLVKINKLVIISFVVPFFYILGMLDRTNYYLSQNNILVLVEEGTVESTVYNFRDLIGFADKMSTIWLIGLVVYLVIYTMTYYVFRFRLRKSSMEIESGPWRRQFHTLCWNGQFPEKKIKLVTSAWMKQLGTIGIINKTIVVPEYLLGKLTDEEIGIILRHELMHIRKNDVALKVGMFVLGSLNWFNPLIYYLNQNLDEWIELSCDEEMLRYADSSYRHAYIDALLKILAEQMEHEELKGHSSVAYFNNGNSVRNIKRRMNGIMKKRVVKKAVRVFAVSSLLCAMACGTALAKELDFSVNALLSDHVEVFDETEYFEEDAFVEADGYDFIGFDGEAMKVSSALMPNGEYIIVYEDGTMEPFSGNIGIEPMHQHSYKDINVKRHQKKSDGSCVVTTYAAVKCTVCGNVLIGKQISQNTYNPCCH